MGDFVRVKQSADDRIYHVKSGDRVRVLIFNHEKYHDKTLTTRTTTNDHRDALKTTFEKLNFKVECFNDLKFKKIKDVLEKGLMNYNFFSMT